MMVIAKIEPPKPLNDTSDHGLVDASNYMNPDQNSKITVTPVSRNQMQDSSGSIWPTCRQSYGSQSRASENGQNDWPTMTSCDSGHWSTGQRFYSNQDHKQPMQEEGNFQNYVQAKYFTPNESYNESLRLVNSTKIDETTSRHTAFRVPVENQLANHQHNYYNPITVNHVHVNYNTTDSYNPTNQHRMYHMEPACDRYQHNPTYAHDNQGCNRAGLLLGGSVATGELSSTMSSPSSASLYQLQHGHENYSSPIRAASHAETSRIPFTEPDKCRQHSNTEQACGSWINQAQYHDYTPQLGGDKLPQSGSHINQANSQQVRATFRAPPLYECSDGVYEHYKPEMNPGVAYVQGGTNTTTNCDQTYRHYSSSSSTIPVAIDCLSRDTNEVTFVAADDSKMSQPLDKLDSNGTASNTGGSGVYHSVQRIQTSVQQQPHVENITQKQAHGLKTGPSISATNQSQFTADRLNQCHICGRNYARPSTLKTHLRTHTNERPYKCAVCRKTFSQAANLTAHQRVHTGERPFPCPICGRQFSQSSSVITHLRTHSGERPYRCAMCNRRFSDSSTLTKHCRIHSGEKPYQCDYCPMNFSQSGNLSRHLRLHLMGGLSKTTSTSAAVGSDSSARNVGPGNVVGTDSGSMAVVSQAASASQRRHSTNLSNSSPESTLSPLI